MDESLAKLQQACDEVREQHSYWRAEVERLQANVSGLVAMAWEAEGHAITMLEKLHAHR